MAGGVGRPGRYRACFANQARKLCLLGAGDAQLADFFAVTEKQLNDWKAVHPDFLAAVTDARAELDSAVERALLQRATGYAHPEDRVFAYQGKAVVVPTTKHYPPDTTACIFWLKNRQPERWRDRQSHEHTGADGGPVQVSGIVAQPVIGSAEDWAREAAIYQKLLTHGQAEGAQGGDHGGVGGSAKNKDRP